MTSVPLLAADTGQTVKHLNAALALNEGRECSEALLEVCDLLASFIEVLVEGLVLLLTAFVLLVQDGIVLLHLFLVG